MVYVDSDFAGDCDQRRSLIGYVFTLYENTISWKASLHHVMAVDEALWLEGLVNKRGIQQDSVIVYCDNQIAIPLCKNNSFHEKISTLILEFTGLKMFYLKGNFRYPRCTQLKI